MVAWSSGAIELFNRAERFAQLVAEFLKMLFPGHSRTWLLSLASASVLANDSPVEQFTALRIRLYWVPICAIEPSMTALLRCPLANFPRNSLA